ncbi:hypothetical protein HYU89_03610 [Candidatus Collierbacteria bacterium]|nr:hypothetical protein [Candidatus Collierbacteria bacterium]
MRLIVYVILFVSTVVILINLAMTNSLASDGRGLAGLMDKEIELNSITANLEADIMVAGSVFSVESRAKELGFNLPLKVVAIKPLPIASKGD